MLGQLHPATARIEPDADGLLPEWIIYHELVATARTFLRWVSRSLLAGLRAHTLSVTAENLSWGNIQSKCALPRRCCDHIIRYSARRCAPWRLNGWTQSCRGCAAGCEAALQLFSVLINYVMLLKCIMQVCPVEAEWVDTVMPRLRGVDVKRLSGGATTEAAKAGAWAEAANGERRTALAN